MSDVSAIGGVYAALVTPFDESRKIDGKALDHLVDYLAQREFAGLSLLTEAAEDLTLTHDERVTIIKRVAKRLKGRKPFFVDVSSTSSLDAVDLGRLAEARGAQAVVVRIPRSPGLGYREIYRHIDRITRSLSVPIILHDRPGNALGALQPEELKTVVEHESLRGVVAPHANSAEIALWVKRFKKRDAVVLSGCSLANAGAHAKGAAGVVCGLVAIAAEQSADLQSLIEAEDEKAISRRESKLAPAVDLLGPKAAATSSDGVERLATKIAKRKLSGGAPPLTYPFPLIKAALVLEGHPIKPDVRPPYETARERDIKKLTSALKRAGVLA